MVGIHFISGLLNFLLQILWNNIKTGGLFNLRDVFFLIDFFCFYCLTYTNFKTIFLVPHTFVGLLIVDDLSLFSATA